MTDKPQDQTLGKYQIVEEIGRGGFATVYRAVDTTLDRQVALKVLDPLLMRDQNWVTRFQREARAVARLKHPHIITIHEIGEAEGQLFIAMELVEGPGLDGLIAERGGLPWDETLEILDQVAEALDYAHGEGIVHRDLKPGNILLDPRRGAVLTDFGFARLVGESSMSVSLSGGVVGTPAYIAPEVWDGKETAPQTDLYSLACIAYEMLMGKVLFDGQTPSVVMRQHLIDGPQFPERWPEGVPGGVEVVLGRGLASEPAKRHSSASAFLAALASAATKPASTAVPEASQPLVEPTLVSSPDAEASPRPRRAGVPRWIWAGAAVGVVAVLVFTVVVLVLLTTLSEGGRPAEVKVTSSPSVAAARAVETPTPLPPPTATRRIQQSPTAVPPTDTPVPEPTSTHIPTATPIAPEPPAEAREMVSFEDPSGVFTLDYPADFGDVGEFGTGGYGHGFADADESHYIRAYFSFFDDAALSDADWEDAAAAVIPTVLEAVHEDAVEVYREEGNPGVHWVYVEMESAVAATHGMVYVEESEGILATVIAEVPADEWPAWEDTLLELLKGFSWWPQAAHDVLAAEAPPEPAPTPESVLPEPTATLVPQPTPTTPASNSFAPEPGRSRLYVGNEYSEELTFTINNQEHKVIVGGEVAIDLDAGKYTFTVSIPFGSVNGEVEMAPGQSWAVFVDEHGSVFAPSQIHP